MSSKPDLGFSNPSSEQIYIAHFPQSNRLLAISPLKRYSRDLRRTKIASWRSACACSGWMVLWHGAGFIEQFRDRRLSIFLACSWKVKVRFQHAEIVVNAEMDATLGF